MASRTAAIGPRAARNRGDALPVTSEQRCEQKRGECPIPHRHQCSSVAARKELDVFISIVVHVEGTVIRTYQESALIIMPVFGSETLRVFSSADYNHNRPWMSSESNAIAHMNLFTGDIM